MVQILSILLVAGFGQFQFIPEQHTGHGEWVEPVVIARIPHIYHPVVRLYGENKFIFETPYLVADGHYTSDDKTVTFTPDLVFELNHSDADKLLAGTSEPGKSQWLDAFNKTMSPISGTWSDDKQTLTVRVPQNGVDKNYELNPLEYGDGARAKAVMPEEQIFVGVWFAPEPHPDRMSPKDRFRFGGLDGLRQFSKEAMESDGEQFGLIDFRQDHTYRVNSDDGTWSFDTVKQLLVVTSSEGRVSKYSVSPDNKYLISNGQRAYQHF